MADETIDTLRLEIESDATESIEGLDRLASKLYELQKSLRLDLSGIHGLKDSIANMAKGSKEMENLAKSVSKLENAIAGGGIKVGVDNKDAEQRIEELRERFRNEGIDFKFQGNSEELDKEIKKTEEKLNTLFERESKQISLGKIDGGAFESLEYDISNTLNKLESMRASMSDIKRSASDMSGVKIHLISESNEKSLEDYIANLQRFKEIIANGGLEGEAGTYMPFAEISHDLDELKDKYPQAIDLAKQFENLLNQSANEQPYESAKYGAEGVTSVMDDLAQRINKVTGALKLSALSTQQFDNYLTKLSIPPINTENLKKLQDDLQKAEQRYESLKTKFSNELLLHDINSEPVRRIQVDIEKTEKEIEALKQKINSVNREAGNINGFIRLNKALLNLPSSAQKISRAFGGIISPLKKFDSLINNVIANIKKMIKSSLGMTSANEKAERSFSLTFKQILRYGFGIRSTFVLLNRLRSALAEGFGNLAVYSGDFNTTISAMQSSLLMLKNAFAAAFEPIVTLVAPYITKFITMLAEAMNVVGQFFSALTGRGFAYQAVGVMTDYADSVAGVGEEAKKAKKNVDNLLGIDELNIIKPDEEDESAGGAGGSGGVCS